jgi:hypothetical protein
MSKLKIARPIICINPGFLCQLLLLSLKSFESPDVKLIIQKSQNIQLKKLDYIDSYKEISHIGHNGKGSNKPITNNAPKLCAESLLKNIQKIENTTICSKKRSCNDLNDEQLQCSTCNYLLANRQDVIVPISYESYLNENTDDYWKGYRPIHPYSSSSSIKLSNIDKNSVIIGPLEWIIIQLKQNKEEQKNEKSNENEKNKKNERINDMKTKNKTLKGTTSNAESSNNTDTYNISCPKCHVICGSYKSDGLELCESFLKCDLFLLNMTKVIIKKS